MKQQTKHHPIHSCPICGNKQFDNYLETKDYFFTKEDFTLSKCSGCDFVLTNPIPELSKLSKYYESPDYLSHTVNKFSLKGFVYDKIRDINIRNKFKLVSRYKQKGNILDIGQGTGELLHYFSGKGWKTVGIEPNESARKYSEAKYGLPVFNEQELDKFESDRFDVITLWHVLEHVTDLNGRMNQIKRLLKEDAYLFIAVPILNSPDSEHYQEYWAGLDVPRHLYHFTANSIDNLLIKHGLVLKNEYPMKFDAYYVSLLSEQYKGTKLPHLPALLNGFRSNSKARRSDNYSSMIFVAEAK